MAGLCSFPWRPGSRAHRVAALVCLCLASGLPAGCDQSGGPAVQIVAPRPAAVTQGGERVSFIAATNGFDGEPVEQSWDFGDNTTASGATAEHAFDCQGCYRVVFRATDSWGDTASDACDVIVVSNRFVKLDARGAVLPDDAPDWDAVYERPAGLIWEVKKNRDGVPEYDDPHDADNTYTWYDDNPLTNGGDAGTPGPGTDTLDFTSQLEAQEFAGCRGWRLPTCDELAALRDPDRFNPAINTKFFPSTVSWYYWSETTYADFPYAACHIYFMGSPVGSGTRVAGIGAFNHYGMKDLTYHTRGVCAADDFPVHWETVSSRH